MLPYKLITVTFKSNNSSVRCELASVCFHLHVMFFCSYVKAKHHTCFILSFYTYKQLLEIVTEQKNPTNQRREDDTDDFT